MPNPIIPEQIQLLKLGFIPSGRSHFFQYKPKNAEEWKTTLHKLDEMKLQYTVTKDRYQIRLESSKRMAGTDSLNSYLHEHKDEFKEATVAITKEKATEKEIIEQSLKQSLDPKLKGKFEKYKQEKEKGLHELEDDLIAKYKNNVDLKIKKEKEISAYINKIIKYLEEKREKLPQITHLEDLKIMETEENKMILDEEIEKLKSHLNKIRPKFYGEEHDTAPIEDELKKYKSQSSGILSKIDKLKDLRRLNPLEIKNKDADKYIDEKDREQFLIKREVVNEDLTKKSKELQEEFKKAVSEEERKLKITNVSDISSILDYTPEELREFIKKHPKAWDKIKGEYKKQLVKGVISGDYDEKYDNLIATDEDPTVVYKKLNPKVPPKIQIPKNVKKMRYK